MGWDAFHRGIVGTFSSLDLLRFRQLFSFALFLDGLGLFS